MGVFANRCSFLFVAHIRRKEWDSCTKIIQSSPSSRSRMPAGGISWQTVKIPSAQEYPVFYSRI